MKAFPKPLSAKEESELFERWKAGDKAARGILIEHNLRLVAHIVKKYVQSDRESEDLLSTGTIGLIKAIDTFDDSKGIRLATYASRCIDNELLMLFRSGKKQSREVYLYDPIGTDKEGNVINLFDIMESVDEDIVEKTEQLEKIEKLRGFVEQVLNEREREIVLMRYGLFGVKEITQREIAEKLGISRSYVSRIEKKALAKLRACYEE